MVSHLDFSLTVDEGEQAEEEEDELATEETRVVLIEFEGTLRLAQPVGRLQCNIPRRLRHSLLFCPQR